MSENDKTVGEKYALLVSQFNQLQASASPKNSKEFQLQTFKLIHEFKIISKIIRELDLFSDNEILEEINVNYLPFFNIDYYLAELYLNFMSNEKLDISIDYKAENLQTAKNHFTAYLDKLVELELLNPLQIKQFNGYNLNREEKINQYKYEQELQNSLSLIDSTKDEDTRRNLYTDQINLFIIKSLNQLQLLDMELIVLSNRPKSDSHKLSNQSNDDDEQQQRRNHLKNPADTFTTKLETLPQNQPINRLVNKGKVLQPFTLTRQDLKNKVFGTGQVLPSMTVEEYLDHELANGKMLQPEEPQPGSEAEDEEDEEAEREQREWDDWKDDNPKGAGNTMNLG